MSRAQYQESLISSAGAALSNASVAVYEPGTTTPIAETMYADDTGGTTLSNPLTADARGRVRFYLAAAKRVDFGITAAGMSPLTREDVPVEDDPANVVHKTGVETLTQKTLSSPIINTPTINGGSWANPDMVDLIVQDRLRIRNGVGGPTVYDATPSLIDSVIRQIITTGNATNPTVTLQNTASGPILRLLDAAGVSSYNFQRLASQEDAAQIFPTFQILNNAKISMRSDNITPRSSMYFDMYRSDANTGTVMAQLIYDNNHMGTPSAADPATIAILGRQMAGDSYFRTVEIDMLRVSTQAYSQPHLGLELSCESAVVGDGSRGTVGIAVHNYGDLWGVPTPKPIDTGLFMGGDNRRMTNFIRAMGNTNDDANAASVLFNVNYQGKMNVGDIYPIADSTKTLGDASNNWLSAWVDTYVSTAGIGSTLHYSLGSGNTGISLPATNAIGFKTNNILGIQIDADGLLDFLNPSNIHFGATGAGAPATLGNTIVGFVQVAQYGWVKFRIGGGGPYYWPVWV